MQKLPLGIQEFSELRNLNCLYIDKTALIYQILEEGKYYFLSRPRRFGKSLLVNTLKEIFLGNQHLFKGLWIEDKIEWESYPVIKIDFTKISYKHQSLNEGIRAFLKDLAQTQEVELDTEDTKQIFLKIINTLYERHTKQVVILIDEYDKPIIDYLDTPEQAEENRDELKNLFSIIKGSDAQIKFFFIVSTHKLFEFNVFSDWNNFIDITLHPRYTTLLGYTQEELYHYFEDRVLHHSQNSQKSTEELWAAVKQHYNGYSWDALNFVYNPFSVLSYMDSGRLDNYWFATGTPTFLTKLLRKGLHYELKEIFAGINSFDTSNLHQLSYIPLLFQTGYLTIKEDVGYSMYRLDFPNQEVKDAFNHLQGDTTLSVSRTG